MRRNVLFQFCLSIAAAACLMACSNSRNETNEKINDLLEKIDASINNTQLTADFVMVVDKSVLRELDELSESEPSVDGKQKILQKALKTGEASISKLNIQYLNDKTRVFRDCDDDIEDHIVFYEPGRSYMIMAADKNGDKKMVMIESLANRFDRLFNTTAHLFGRGLSAVTDYPTDLEQISEEVYQLTVYDKKDCYKKKMECILDADKDYCWTSRKIFGPGGSLSVDCVADDFRQANGSWFPYRVEMKSYRKDALGSYYLLTVTDIKALPADVKELKVEDDIPENAEIFKHSTN